MLEPWEISSFYINSALKVPHIWNLSRKHVRVRTSDGKFVKLNKFENRINAKELRDYCVHLSPVHVYFSVLDWLFPERVGKKYKANYAVPISGEYVVDVDSYVIHKWHNHFYHKIWNVCRECVQIAKEITINACIQIEQYYSDIAIVFSGKNGFHIHVLDFDLKDWTRYNERDPIKSHEVARFKFTKTISLETYCFDRSHFIVSTDPMRIITVPSTLNAESGLVCTYIGDRKDLELQTVENIVTNASPMLQRYGYPEPVEQGIAKTGWPSKLRAVKHMHKTGGRNMARVTAMTPPPTKTRRQKPATAQALLTD